MARSATKSERRRHSEVFRVASFFAGIGGFDRAFELEGAKTVFQCELDNYCRTVLQTRFPGVALHDDIKTLSSDALPDSEIWTGGFPCQDVSVARGWLGREGLSGERSGLFFPLLDLARQRLPKVILLENVTGLLSSHNGNDFGVILESLADLGYATAWRVLNARYLGSPQSRPRVFIAAAFDSPDIAGGALYDETMSPVLEPERLGFLSASHCPSTGVTVPKVAYCLAATSGRHTGTDWSRSYITYPDRVRRLTPVECEGLQGFPTNWTVPLGENESNDDLDSLRYHALGNAVSVSTVRWIAERLLRALTQSKRGPSDFGDQANRFGELSKCDEFDADTLLHGALDKSPWGTGGLAWKGRVLMGRVSPSPARPIEVPFLDVVERQMPDDKYFLSPNAAQGILRRVRSQGRQLFPPLEQSLVLLAGERI